MREIYGKERGTMTDKAFRDWTLEKLKERYQVILERIL
jgi:hypothetical protein